MEDRGRRPDFRTPFGQRSRDTTGIVPDSALEWRLFISDPGRWERQGKDGGWVEVQHSGQSHRRETDHRVSALSE